MQFHHLCFKERKKLFRIVSSLSRNRLNTGKNTNKYYINPTYASYSSLYPSFSQNCTIHLQVFYKRSATRNLPCIQPMIIILQSFLHFLIHGKVNRHLQVLYYLSYGNLME